MPRHQTTLWNVQTKVLLPTRNAQGRYIYTAGGSDVNPGDTDAPHPKSTVDARPGMQAYGVKTYWWDPNSVGRSQETVYYELNPKPTKTTPGTRYDRVLYYRFTVGLGTDQKTYQYKRRIVYLRDVASATPDDPWVASGDTTGEVYQVDAVNNQLVDRNGLTYPMEPVI